MILIGMAKLLAPLDNMPILVFYSVSPDTMPYETILCYAFLTVQVCVNKVSRIGLPLYKSFSYPKMPCLGRSRWLRHFPYEGRKTTLCSHIPVAKSA
jgi:hypothetical protein